MSEEGTRDPQTAEEAGTTEEGQTSAAGTSNMIMDLADQTSLPYTGIVASAIVLLVALCINSTYKSHKYFEYGVSVAAIAMFFALVGWAMGRFNAGSDKLTMYNNYFLFTWCFIGACFLTFGGPFKVTSNGYFGAWGLAVFATMALGINASSVRDVDMGAGSTMGLLASSIITLTALASEGFNKSDEEYPSMVYGMCLTCFTIVLVGGMMKLEQQSGEPNKMKLPLLVVFGIMWLTLACLLTFKGPFLTTGNGYFASWAGAVTALYAANAAKKAAYSSSS